MLTVEENKKTGACQENNDLWGVPVLKVYLMTMNIGHGDCYFVHRVIHPGQVLLVRAHSIYSLEDREDREDNLMSLPPPPLSHHNAAWPPNVVQAEYALRDIYRVSSQVLSLPTVDPRHVEFHLRAITSDAVPILLALDDSCPSKKLWRWVSKCADEFAGICLRLMELGDVQTRGRPRKVIDPSYLHKAMALKHRVSVSELARALKVSRQTLTSYLKKHGIDYKFSNISNKQLDELVKDFQEKKPSSGIRYLTGFLRRSHVLRARRVRKTQRVPYLVSHPNALWHIDGHHKLILWGIVIHGVVDGYSQKVPGIQASDNNRASTVLKMFTRAVKKYGWPSHGFRCGSFIWGSSTHNTRIERLWVEVGTQFVRAWRAFFFRLESLHYLDRKNPHHLWLLHLLFLNSIDSDCREFQKDWNAHPISRVGHDRSPNDLYLLGRLQHGYYKDGCTGIHPDNITENYGVHGTPIHRQAHQTGPGHDPEEENDDDDDSTDTESWYGIQDDGSDTDAESWYGIDSSDANENETEHNFLPAIVAEDGDHTIYETVDAPKNVNPFSDETYRVFLDAFTKLTGGKSL
ncbi:hypothetical protein D9758_008964 [Tetrapyrgos nigripes]|uniref:Integrase core domain-containing protein n=1 Tax=Tetrapyrgos nigripes TaxID=182062 RepID=A0A8H5GKC7_9AGAR|nr:hypothetical protein D9758_008964 [Tetrapyrgos nigripes]